ncbi:41 helicase [uncultured Caudovirales phage]|uniref:DnaB-like replicative helicase n=1 Tax=uncultured Caudovirales phage TaxID=2100421 RepID=A0A6J5MF36_9CAUD|nr:41 helicase [uncultured Caudovirales phage]
MNLERAIFNNLLNNETYARKTIPFLKPDYFHNRNDKVVFELINSYVMEYNAFPTKEALLVDLNNRDNISEDQFKECKELVEEIPDQSDQLSNVDWLVDQTEKFCQDKAIYNAIMQSIQIMDDKTGKMAKGSIPQLLSDALAVSFDTSIGHDFIEDADSRFEFYHRKEERLPFDIDFLNKITRGGLPRKTLNILLAGTGVGKTLAMCHFAASYMAAGKNVLYITMEMAEEKIAERIDANLLNVPLDELGVLPKESYDKKMTRLKEKTIGRLIVKEYPTSTAGAANFRHLLNELKIKKNFVPDVIFIDYLNICMSSRLKQGANVNSYTYIKAIAEELRGLAVEFNVPIISATQTTRSGYDSSDVGLTDTSESFGLPATADFMVALIATDELKALNQIMVKQLKNRYSDPEMYKRFVVGVDRPRMRLYDAEQSAQDDIVDDSPVYDNTPSGKFDKEKFSGFK